VIGLFVALARHGPTADDTRAAAGKSVPPQRVAFDPHIPPEPMSRHDDEVNHMLGIVTGWMCFALFLGIGYLVSLLLLVVWVVKDARNRSIENGLLWAIVILGSHIIGLLIYLATRLNGLLILCQHCGNKRLEYVRLCPHCQYPTGSTAPPQAPLI
jgi:lipid-A-disaccharide synthase-like uncharacterized protein